MSIDTETLNLINNGFQRLEDRFNQVMQQYLRKDEYEVRHKRLESDILELELASKQDKKWAMEEHEQLRKEMRDAITSIGKSQLRARDFVISVLIAFMTGGGAIGLITFLYSIHH